MNAFEVNALKPALIFTDHLILDKQFLVLGKGFPVTHELLKELITWGFTSVSSEGTIDDGTQDKDIINRDSSDIIFETQQEEAAAAEERAREREEKDSALNNSLKDATKLIQTLNTESSRLEMTHKVYKDYSDYIESLYTRYSTHKEIDKEQLSKVVQELIYFVRENRRFVLRVNPRAEQTDKKFLVNHAMRSTVIALTIGIRLRLQFTQLIELGQACILHEIGMLRLPPQLYITDKKLQPQEKAKLASHPILGYELVKEVGFTLPIQRAVLEHHEKENGSGYPRHISAEDISTYAKIIAVACAFEAITAPRHYRSARPKYEAMLEILRNSNNQYDENVIKALLYSFSIFPIGVYVYLANGKIARITDTKPDDPRHPIAQILGETAADGDPRTVETDEGSNKVVRVLNQQEESDVLKSLGLTDD
ncbi:MAG: HD domain-containing protein [Treponema sp.]|nr:HD domain-containing protein [Treponema sp.]